MGVRDHLPVWNVVAEIKELEQNAAELKSAQTLGADSIVTSRIFSSAIYDVAIPPGSITRTVTVEFIPNDLTFGGAFCHRLITKEMTATNAPFQRAVKMMRVPVTDNRQRWTYSIVPFDEQRLKFYFFTTGSGTFTVNLL